VALAQAAQRRIALLALPHACTFRVEALRGRATRDFDQPRLMTLATVVGYKVETLRAAENYFNFIIDYRQNIQFSVKELGIRQTYYYGENATTRSLEDVHTRRLRKRLRLKKIEDRW
jgi:hypothetical protein